MAVIDVPESDHDRELAFWRAATGQPFKQVEQHPDYHVARLHSQEAWLLIQRLGTGPARVHLDIHTDDLAAEAARLEGHGARRVEQVHDWLLMRDPAGLVFCVVPDPPGGLSDANAQRWD
jgi:catechol 2,3-dioxygenase-like lactoylglutathione lyase family enzyme